MDTIKKIIAMAKVRGLTLQDLESRAGLPAGRISKWRAGQGEPSASQVWAISKILDVDVRYLLDDERETEGEG